MSRFPMLLFVLAGCAPSRLSDTGLSETALEPRELPPKRPVGPLLDSSLVLSTELHVKLRDELHLRPEAGSLVARGDIRRVLRLLDDAEVTPLVSDSPELRAMLRRAETRTGKIQPDLAGMIRVTGLPPSELALRAEALQELDEVEFAEVVQQPLALPTVVDLRAYQTYRDPDWATGGIGSYGLGWTGKGVRITDVEYAYNPDHVDLSAVPIESVAGSLSASATQTPYCSYSTTDDPATTPTDESVFCTSSTDHGTAVLSILAGSADGVGITGLAYGATFAFASEWTVEDGHRRVQAIADACVASSPGDIVVLEQQTSGLAGAEDYVPAEYDSAVWFNSAACVASGIVLVVAAGNGGVDLDSDPAYAKVGKSGAILVGAGTPNHQHDQIIDTYWASTYGQAVDLQGWGEGVFAGGYGYGTPLPPTVNRNEQFTYFGGTSSATPIVVGAAALLQEAAITYCGEPLSPADLMDVLISTGTPQGSGGHIGPIPDVSAAVHIFDRDGDGYAAEEVDVGQDGVADFTCGGDCDDSNAARAPGLTEIEDNQDNDCDGVVDEDILDPTSQCGYAAIERESCDNAHQACHQYVFCDPSVTGGALQDQVPDNGQWWSSSHTYYTSDAYQFCDAMGLRLATEDDIDERDWMRGAAASFAGNRWWVYSALHETITLPRSGDTADTGTYDTGDFEDVRADLDTSTPEFETAEGAYAIVTGHEWAAHVYVEQAAPLAFVCETKCGPGAFEYATAGYGGYGSADPWSEFDTTEVCDGVDNDCDGLVDEGTPKNYTDVEDCTNRLDDNCDGRADAADLGCEENMASGGCNGYDDNGDGLVDEGCPPEDTECNGVDDDGDGLIDEGWLIATGWPDADHDGYGAFGSTYVEEACVPSPEDWRDGVEDGRGYPQYVGNEDDCDDLDYWTQGVFLAGYADQDGDGFGDELSPIVFCEGLLPDGNVENADDCDDSDASVQTPSDWFLDGDGDGFGDGAALSSCFSPAASWLVTDGDCNDSAATAFPGGVETCDSLDNDCDSVVDDGLDCSAPTEPVVVINGGAATAKSRTVTLALSATDDVGVTEVCLSNTSSCSAWLPYAATQTWTLGAGQGVRTVYARFRDAAGKTSAAASDSTLLDTVKPTNGVLTGVAGDGQIELSWTGFSDTTSGIASYTVVMGTTSAPASCTVGTVAWTGTGTSTTVTGLSDGTTYGFRVCATDAAGNLSAGARVTVRAGTDLTAPTGTVTVSGGAAWTTSTSVSLDLSAVDASGLSSMCISNAASCSAWVPYATSMAWTLGGSGTSRTVYARFRDPSGNTSATASDTIDLDATRPTNGAVSATPVSGGVELSWSGFSDVRSGIASYLVVEERTSAPSSCSTGNLVASGASTTASVTGLTSGKHGFRVCAVDVAGNVSTGAAVNAIVP